MNKDYIKNLAGSPFIDEGLWDKLKGIAMPSKDPKYAPLKPVPPKPHPSPEPPKTKELDANAVDFLNNVINEVIDTVVHEVQKDYRRSNPYFEVKTLPQQFNDPEWDAVKNKTGHKTANPTTTQTHKIKLPGEQEEEDLEPNTDPDDPADAGDGFLYKFHSRHNKYRHFTMSVGKFPLKGSDGKDKNYEVLWACHGHPGDVKHAYMNTIFIKTISETDGKIKNIKIFEFFDHEVDSRTDEGKNFSIKKIFYPGNPKFAQVYKENKYTTDQFQRALMATVGRKAMEFKYTKKDKELAGQGENVQNAVMSLIKLNFKKDDAIKYVNTAVEALGATASEQDLVNYALSKKPNPPPETKVKPKEPSSPPTPSNLPSNPKPEDAASKIDYSAGIPIPKPEDIAALKQPKPKSEPLVNLPAKPEEPKQDEIDFELLKKEVASFIPNDVNFSYTNTALQSIGVDPLDSPDQIGTFVGIINSYNNTIINQAMAMSDKAEQKNFLEKNILQPSISKSQQPKWSIVVTKTKENMVQINTDGTIDWKGKKFKMGNILPKNLGNAIEMSGQQEKFNAIMKSLKKPKNPLNY